MYHVAMIWRKLRIRRVDPHGPETHKNAAHTYRWKIIENAIGKYNYELARLFIFDQAHNLIEYLSIYQLHF